jgi:hypothetical protein
MVCSNNSKSSCKGDVRTDRLGEEIAGVYRVALFVRRFRRERGDDSFEARIAAERVPVRQQFELAGKENGVVSKHLTF